ncbi:MAG TPA: DUF4136 domain-containing protein [Thermoanaerobaculia bacterium]|nr:DUF4136 domain-containing protein [Thermoanaerobaculia bacterium]
MKKLLPGILSLALLVVGCSSLETGADYEPGTDFSKYRTFSFQEGSGQPSHPFVVERVRRAVAATLEGKGWKAVESGGDATVYTHFHLDSRTQMTTTDYASAGWYGWRWGGGVATTTVSEIPVGTIVIDVVDSAEKKLLWRGWGKDDVTSRRSPEEAEAYARKVMAKLFENFPPAK